MRIDHVQNPEPWGFWVLDIRNRLHLEKRNLSPKGAQCGPVGRCPESSHHALSGLGKRTGKGRPSGSRGVAPGSPITPLQGSGRDQGRAGRTPTGRHAKARGNAPGTGRAPTGRHAKARGNAPGTGGAHKRNLSPEGAQCVPAGRCPKSPHHALSGLRKRSRQCVPSPNGATCESPGQRPGDRGHPNKRNLSPEGAQCVPAGRCPRLSRHALSGLRKRSRQCVPSPKGAACESPGQRPGNRGRLNKRNLSPEGAHCVPVGHCPKSLHHALSGLGKRSRTPGTG